MDRMDVIAVGIKGFIEISTPPNVRKGCGFTYCSTVLIFSVEIGGGEKGMSTVGYKIGVLSIFTNVDHAGLWNGMLCGFGRIDLFADEGLVKYFFSAVRSSVVGTVCFECCHRQIPQAV